MRRAGWSGVCARARGISEKGHEGLILQTIVYKMKTTGPSYFAVDFAQNLAARHVSELRTSAECLV